jgi:DNA-binding beta-propeller fold protein YncE
MGPHSKSANHRRHESAIQRRRRRLLHSVLPAALAAIAVTLVALSPRPAKELWRSQLSALRRATGEPQLLAVEAAVANLPAGTALEGEMCQWLPASASSTTGSMSTMSPMSRMSMTPAMLAPALQEAGHGATFNPKDTGNSDREPVRKIRDTYPTYSAIAVNLKTNEVFLQDENLFGIKVFERTLNTPASANFSEPKRSIAGGGITKLEFNCGIYVDPQTGDIYSVTNDTIDTLTVFPWNAKGEMKPKRELYTPHGTFGISVDEDAQEMYMTVQHDNSVVVYPKTAAGEDKPKRELVGEKTQMEDPHGIAVDYKNKLMFVSNHGNSIVKQTDSGKFEPPSITVYPLYAEGDTAPLRIIQGSKTRLNWPANMWVDGTRGELYVANDGDDSILVFKTNDQGDAAPVRMLRGPKTHISKPTGVFLDEKNNELWVANMGNHAAVVFNRTATGDAAPKRMIRSAPLEKKALAIGNPGAVAYDSTRDEILVPN